MRSRLRLVWFGLLLLGGCQTARRRAAPPDMIGQVAPKGFAARIRLLTIDSGGFNALATAFFHGLGTAATDGSIDTCRIRRPAPSLPGDCRRALHGATIRCSSGSTTS
jgi:hypothetical protein